MVIAIIDDGVYDGKFFNNKILKNLFIDNDKIVKNEVNKKKSSHGTICAAIISDLYNDVKFISIKILDEEGNGYIDHLITALRWCLLNNIKVIQMSLGTANYHDFSKIEPLVQKLTESNIIMISSFHNMNIPSYPAYLPKVLGVRSDRYRLIQNGMFMIDYKSGMRIENSLISHYDKKLVDDEGFLYETEGSNSYAASVITAHVIRILELNKNITLDNLMVNLINLAQNVDYPKVFKMYSRWDYNVTNAPVILIQDNNRNIFEKIVYEFTNDNYYIEAFSELNRQDNNIIPLEFYSDEILTNGLLFVLNTIYTPDVILIETDKINYYKSVKNIWDLVDIYIECKNNYLIYTKNYELRVYSIHELYQSIINCFT